MYLDKEIDKKGYVPTGELESYEPDMEAIDKFLNGELSVSMDDTNESLIEQIEEESNE